MANYTKGEWDFTPQADENDPLITHWMISSEERADLIAQVNFGGMHEITEDEGRANAILISAAPELKNACNIVLNNLISNRKFGNTLSEQEMDAAINILQKAINKAKGK